jgi:Flp pilus assembly protein TadG
MRLCNSRNEIHQRCGTAAVELALVLPFLVFVTVVAIDYCRVFYFSQTVRNCASVAAMRACGAATQQTSNLVIAAQDAALAEGVSLNPPLQASNVNVQISYTTQTATVTVTYTYVTVAGYFGLPREILLTEQITFPVLPQAGGATPCS